MSNITGLDTSLYADKLDVPFIGSIIYSSNGKMVTSIKKVSNNLTIMANSANYTPNAQKIILTAKLYNRENKLVKTYSKTNTIMRNMPGREYVTDKGVVLKKVTMSDFPQNIATTLKITDLPSNLSDYYMIVNISKGNKVLRTSQIGNKFKLVNLSVKVNKDKYKVGDTLNKDDIEVKATYSDGVSKVVDNYTIIGNKGLKEGNNTITISYTSGTKTIKKNIKAVIEPNNKSNDESDTKTDNESNNDSDKEIDNKTDNESNVESEKPKEDEKASTLSHTKENIFYIVLGILVIISIITGAIYYKKKNR